MEGMELSPPRGLMYGGGSEPMVSLYHDTIMAQQKQQEDAAAQAKSSVASLLSTYNGSQSEAMRGHVIDTLKGYYAELPHALQKEIKPYLANGPTSPTEDKRREFIAHNPPPREPQLPEGKMSEAAAPLYEQRMAEHAFALSDWQKQMQAFVYGPSSAGEKQIFIPYGDGRAAVRGKDGQVMILSQQDLALKEMSDKSGVSVRDLILKQGQIPTGTKGFTVVNGQKITTENMENKFASDPKDRYYTRPVNVEAMPKSTDNTKHPDKLITLMLELKAEKPKDPGTQALRALALEHPDKAAEQLSTMFPDYSFNITKEKLDTWTSRHIPLLSSGDDNLNIIPIKGHLQQFGSKWYYYDGTVVRNAKGIPLGSAETVMAEIANRGGK